MKVFIGCTWDQASIGDCGEVAFSVGIIRSLLLIIEMAACNNQPDCTYNYLHLNLFVNFCSFNRGFSVVPCDSFYVVVNVLWSLYMCQCPRYTNADHH